MERIARGDRVVHPRDHEELLEMVRQNLEEANGEPVTVDSDGDFTLRVGSSVLFVRVWDPEPAIGLFAEVVVDV